MSLNHGDLKGTIDPIISIDEFEPKAGDIEDIIVVAFYLVDEDPADDLNTFIQRSVIDKLCVDVSTNTDDDGKYLVFVEMNRDETFPEKFKALIRDVENVSGRQEWKIKTYLSDDKEFDYNDPKLYKFIIIDPAKYVDKDEFMKESMQSDIKAFLQDAHITHLDFNDKKITLSSGSNKIIAEVVDVGDYDEVIGRNSLAESAFKLTDRPLEAKVLTGLLGVYDVMPIDKFLCIGKNDKVMLLRNTEIKYRG